MNVQWIGKAATGALLLALVAFAGRAAAQQDQDQQADQQTSQNQQDGEQGQNEPQNRADQQASAPRHQQDEGETHYHGHERASLGVVLSESERNGVRIAQVLPGSPAARAQLQPGDRIERIDNQPIGSYRDLIRLLNAKQSGDQVTLAFQRRGQSRQANVTLEPRQEFAQQGNQFPQGGWQDQDARYSANERDRFDQEYGWNRGGEDRSDQRGWRNEPRQYGGRQQSFGWQGRGGQPMLGISVNRSRQGGLTVTSVYPGGPADRAGIQEGDQILALDGRRVQSEQQIQSALREHRLGDQVALDVSRDGQRERLLATLESREQIVRAGPSTEEPYDAQGPMSRRRQFSRGSQGGADQDRFDQDQYNRQGQGRFGQGQFQGREDQYDNRFGQGGTQWMGDAGSHEPAIGVAMAPERGRTGVLIAEVFENSPAQHAGLRPGDEILAIDGREVQSAQQLAREVQRHRPHQAIEVVVDRNGRQRTMNVRLAQRRELQEEGIDDRQSMRGSDRYDQDFDDSQDDRMDDSY